VKYRGLATRSREGKLRGGIERTVIIDEISRRGKTKEAERGTYGLVVKLAESVKDLCDHGRPRRYVFSLCVSLEFCVVLQDTQPEAACAKRVSVRGNMTGKERQVTYGSNRSATCGRAVW